MEDIIGADYAHTKKFCKDFEIKNLGKQHDLHAQRETLLANIFESFRNMCLEIYEFDPAHFLTAPGLAWQSDLLTDINVLLMLEKGIRRITRHSIYRYAKVGNKYMKVYNKNKEPLYLQYWIVNSLHD